VSLPWQTVPMPLMSVLVVTVPDAFPPEKNWPVIVSLLSVPVPPEIFPERLV
jgi:hypothetical protein